MGDHPVRAQAHLTSATQGQAIRGRHHRKGGIPGLLPDLLALGDKAVNGAELPAIHVIHKEFDVRPRGKRTGHANSLIADNQADAVFFNIIQGCGEKL